MSKKDKDISSEKETSENEETQASLEREWSDQEIKELIAQAEAVQEAQEKLIRVQADFENHKKRLMREKEEFLKFANVGLIESILPILDNFDLALQHAEKDHDPEHVLQGVQMIRKMFGDVLNRQGLQELNPIEEQFDPHKHEAIAFEETDDKEEGLVVDVLQTGYVLHDRLIRPAKVRITKKKSVEKDKE